MGMTKQWIGPLPRECEMNKCSLADGFVDGRLESGVWAIMCLPCHGRYGGGLGVGKGQRYDAEGCRIVSGPEKREHI